MYASSNGHKDIVSLLLSKSNIDVNIQDNVSIYIVVYNLYCKETYIMQYIYIL